MGAYRKLILDETTNTLTGKGFEENSNSHVSSQVKKFDSYSAEKVRDLFAEYDRVAVNETDLKSLTLVKADAVTKQGLSFRAKLFTISASVVLSLMLFLVIYNFVVINSLNSGIQLLQNNVVAEQNSYNQIVEYSNGNAVKIKENLEAQGYSVVNESDIVTIELGETKAVYELKGETNWFDALCDFVSNLFVGG